MLVAGRLLDTLLQYLWELVSYHSTFAMLTALLVNFHISLSLTVCLPHSSWGLFSFYCPFHWMIEDIISEKLHSGEKLLLLELERSGSVFLPSLFTVQLYKINYFFKHMVKSENSNRIKVQHSKYQATAIFTASSASSYCLPHVYKQCIHCFW